MFPLVVATTNAGKFKEISALLEGLPCELNSLKDFDNMPEIPEEGLTYQENALHKAQVIAKLLGVPVLADDSGLEVDALDGEPGVFSARWAGEDCDFRENNKKLLESLKDVPLSARGAKFVCVMAFVPVGGKPTIVRGECRGFIPYDPVGEEGFGYDPLFGVPQMGRTMAQLTFDEKNKLSHRARAIQKMMPLLKSTFLGYLSHP